MNLSGKVAIVTGASSGIGAATAIMLCSEGARVALVGRNEEKLRNVSEKCANAGGKNLIINADVSNEIHARRIINDTVNKFGQLDILINNAGILRHCSLSDHSDMKAYDEVMNVNMRAVFFLTSLAVPLLKETKGNIVNISSGAGVSALPTYISYSISKAALNHFGKVAANQLAPFGIRVNTVSPGPVRTDILDNAGMSSDWEKNGKGTPLRRFSEPEEIADVILFLASEKAKGVTGSNYVTDNGFLVMS
jgi:NAD(P)-dependent dehydrogenase (short-subunit alcohol dehydrogenase family)